MADLFILSINDSESGIEKGRVNQKHLDNIRTNWHDSTGIGIFLKSSSSEFFLRFHTFQIHLVFDAEPMH